MPENLRRARRAVGEDLVQVLEPVLDPLDRRRLKDLLPAPAERVDFVSECLYPRLRLRERLGQRLGSRTDLAPALQPFAPLQRAGIDVVLGRDRPAAVAASAFVQRKQDCDDFREIKRGQGQQPLPANPL